MEGQAPDPRAMRVSDADRHQVAEVLRHAAGEGRIDLEELDERLEAAYGAKTYADLVPITADLPVQATGQAVTPRPATGPVAAATRHASSLSVMGDCTRKGVWRISAKHNAFALMGGVRLDLREAQFEARETVIEAYAVMAGIDIVVNPQTRIVVEGIGIMGGFGEERHKAPAEIGPDSPVVRVRGLALMGGVGVRRKPLPGTSRNRLGITNR